MDTRAQIERFLDSPGLGEATRRAYRFDLDAFAGWLQGQRVSLDDVDARVLADYAAELGRGRPRRLSPASLARKLAAVRALLRFSLGPERVPVRLVALPVPEEVANLRRHRAKSSAQRRHRSPPGKEHLFLMGSDSFGRDIYSRVLYGTRVSLMVGLCSALAALACGIVLGLAAGYIRWLDGPLMRVMDGVMAIPAILIAIGAGLFLSRRHR